MKTSSPLTKHWDTHYLTTNEDSQSFASRGSIFVYEVEKVIQKSCETFFASPPQLLRVLSSYRVPRIHETGINTRASSGLVYSASTSSPTQYSRVQISSTQPNRPKRRVANLRYLSVSGEREPKYPKSGYRSSVIIKHADALNRYF